MIYWQLVVVFFKIGLFTFGGGYAMLPLIQQEISHHQWLSSAEFIDIIAIAEMTPGAIAVNMATFIGFRTGGILGSIVATTAIALPSFIFINSLARFWKTHREHQIVKRVFAGIRPAVVGLIGAAAVYIGQSILVVPAVANSVDAWAIDRPSVLIALGVFVAVRRFKADPIHALLASAVLGLWFFS